MGVQKYRKLGYCCCFHVLKQVSFKNEQISITGNKKGLNYHYNPNINLILAKRLWLLLRIAPRLI